MTMKARTIFWTAAILANVAIFHGCDSAPPETGMAKIAVTSDKAVTVREDFQSKLQDWKFVQGDWRQRMSDGSGVLAQTAEGYAFPVALWKKLRFGDVDVTVRFKPISGRIDASGGIVFRAKDDRNYYVVRANSLENNYRLYTVVNGRRSKIAGTTIDAPSLGQWHTLRVVAMGTHIQAYLDDSLLIDHRDEMYSDGWVGLWTKADAVTEFNDLVVKGIPAESD